MYRESLPLSYIASYPFDFNLPKNGTRVGEMFYLHGQSKFAIWNGTDWVITDCAETMEIKRTIDDVSVRVGRGNQNLITWKINEYETLTATDRLDRKGIKQFNNCPNCGAPYNGNERCEYCGTYLGPAYGWLPTKRPKPLGNPKTR